MKLFPKNPDLQETDFQILCQAYNAAEYYPMCALNTAQPYELINVVEEMNSIADIIDGSEDLRRLHSASMRLFLSSPPEELDVLEMVNPDREKWLVGNYEEGAERDPWVFSIFHYWQEREENYSRKAKTLNQGSSSNYSFSQPKRDKDPAYWVPVGASAHFCHWTYYLAKMWRPSGVWAIVTANRYHSVVDLSNYSVFDMLAHLDNGNPAFRSLLTLSGIVVPFNCCVEIQSDSLLEFEDNQTGLSIVN